MPEITYNEKSFDSASGCVAQRCKQMAKKKTYACLTAAKKQTGRTEVLMMSPFRTQPQDPLPLTMPHLHWDCHRVHLWVLWDPCHSNFHAHFGQLPWVLYLGGCWRHSISILPSDKFWDVPPETWEARVGSVGSMSFCCSFLLWTLEMKLPVKPWCCWNR